MRPKDRLTLAWILLTLRTTIGQGEFTENLPDNVREQRSYPQTPIIDMLMQSVAPNYTPSSPNDIFDFLRDSYPLPNGLKSPLKEYDYVIVGAGSAGCALASRLTEDPGVTVLLLEAGRPEQVPTDVPAIAPWFQFTDYVWPYYMERQPNMCLGMRNKRCFWPRGRAVGGSSVINYMIYTRGRPGDWDRIAKDGNYGWSYSDVLKYYMKSERSNLRGFEYSPYRGRAGNLNVEFIEYKTPLIESFLEAGRILGRPTVDYNAPEEMGFGYVQATVLGGRRVSAAKAFLHPYKNRTNLHILPVSRVTKVLINPENKQAYGVQYVRNKLNYEVHARREVILSAGPIASPQLLMLSGIGPKEQLSKHGIPLIEELPVGQTLYDHITFPGLIYTLNTTRVSLIENRETTLNTVVQWLQFGDSAMASPGAVEGIGYIKTPNSKEPADIPDIELISIGGSLVSDGGEGASKGVRRGMTISEKVFDEAYGSIDATETWSAFPMLLHPKSTGYLELKDNNPFSFPRMYGNYLTERVDVSEFVASIRYIQKMASTEPFQRYGARLHQPRFSKCRKLEFDSDEYWECALRVLAVSLHHQIATCRMGPPSDPRAVVDPELRVYGVGGLRVVDSSVIPRTISAHTNAPAIMIGEKAADMIKQKWSFLNKGS
ncbi:glucose dehydrogenase [FAD, quinone]-like [Plutella xylostella]|uniref:glucose dehydrogenase [FAD, quinone]-like n=1 Tax=Plutella xylostella TaxID=51655 RepID=UPI002032A17F|nr:glucose dehydrogenase [FAD, quinone]-like [Plutella xylostella]